jgi:hypothetical protein
MPLTCPACGKSHQTAAACPRCGCDLSRLHAIVAAAAARLRAAVTAIADRDWPSALASAEQSWRLCHSPEAARLAFLAAGAQGDTGRALAWRDRALALETIPPTVSA